jgi:hypothetical protein
MISVNGSGPRAFLLVNRHREENNVNTAVWIEIEKLRRASLGTLRAKHREVFQEETPCRRREHLFRRIAWRPEPGALFPGREYPRFMYHATKPPIAFFWQPASNGLRMQSKSFGLQFVGEVFSAAEERAPEWSRIYIHQEYPK